jgi:pimeloyl-ACP methyl ester carboxylesterase
MTTVRINGVELDVVVAGHGEPVLLIHGSPLSDAFRPLTQESALHERFRLVHYHRRGYGHALGPSEGWATIADQAADAAGLLDWLGIEAAHIAGYDLGGLVALQLAIDRPARVGSVALIEPILMMVPSAADVAPGIVPALDRYRLDDAAGAARVLVELSAGPEAVQILDGQLPGAMQQATLDAPTFFDEEFFALVEWEPSPSDWGGIRQPVLSVVGERSHPFFAEGRLALHEAISQTEDFDVFSAGHLLPVENPEALATGLASFFARHPLPRSGPPEPAHDAAPTRGGTAGKD